ncbi:hypothetical protein D9M72_274530 [compost metagenome]
MNGWNVWHARDPLACHPDGSESAALKHADGRCRRKDGEVDLPGSQRVACSGGAAEGNVLKLDACGLRQHGRREVIHAAISWCGVGQRRGSLACSLEEGLQIFDWRVSTHGKHDVPRAKDHDRHKIARDVIARLAVEGRIDHMI